MDEHSSETVTVLLNRAATGDRAATERLFDRVHQELRLIAGIRRSVVLSEISKGEVGRQSCSATTEITEELVNRLDISVFNRLFEDDFSTQRRLRRIPLVSNYRERS